MVRQRAEELLASHPDLEAEQAHIDRSYERLEAMRQGAAARLQDALHQPAGGTPQAREERDVVVRSSLQRIDQLDLGDQALVFGRIDQAPTAPGDSAPGEVFHIGRLGVAADDLEPLVVDWRAPVAEPFYRATGRQPMGLTRRRHFAVERRRVLAIEDELFALGRSRSGRTPEAGRSAEDGDEVGGSGALLAALERSRSGFMRDIVATVQREQDEIIRTPLPGVLIVQGGPGTGKTAVALHRAAYLLYTHRFPLERQGVLVVGPNPVFLRYIEQVLPSLGETGVALSTVAGLVAGVSPRAAEPAATAALKGETRMAEVLARAVRDRQRPLRLGVPLRFGASLLELGVDDSAAAVGAGRRRGGSHNSRRRLVESVLARRLHAQLEAARARGRNGEDPAPGVGELWRELRRRPEVSGALERMWPRLLAEELVHDLLGAPALLASAGRGLISREEQGLLARQRSSALEDIAWTPADMALLDEAGVLLGPVRSGEGELRSYGHIVVDEAQDLSPMQLRMLTRRSLSGSMTVVGDIAQATGTRPPSGWEEVAEHLPSGRPPRLVELSVNYRTPAEVMDVAGQVLGVAAPGVRLPRSVRSTGTRPEVVRVERRRLGVEVAERAARQAASVGEGTVAVVCPARLLGELAGALEEAGLPASHAVDAGLGSAVTLVPVVLVKGLEFDSVVVVEPAGIVEEVGLRALYVALTRPTRRLAVVHAEPIPIPLSA